MHELGPGDFLPRDFLPTGGFPYASCAADPLPVDCAHKARMSQVDSAATR